MGFSRRWRCAGRDQLEWQHDDSRRQRLAANGAVVSVQTSSGNVTIGQ